MLVSLSSKELMHLEDFLTTEQSSVKTLNHFANMSQDQQLKQSLQQLAQKCQQDFQLMSKHLSAGQTMQ